MADQPFVPYVPAEKRLAELTVKAVILGIVLSIVLGAANAYLGLRVGLTVSASIPAAVVSMGVLKLFRKHNILENNLVQTAASAGESLAAGVLFTVPALVLLEYWTSVQYIETAVIALVGGVLGVLFTVPLRKALIVEAQLTFPEGVATAEVLKAGERGKEGGALVALVVGGVVGAVYKFFESGIKVWSASAVFGRRFGDNGVIAFGSDLSPALLGVGYIIRLHIASLVFLGGVIGWLIGIPLYSVLAGDSASLVGGLDAVSAAGTLWSTRIRYMGVGAMLVGGVWSLIKLRKPLVSAIKQGMAAAGPQGKAVLRTEKEFGMRATFFGVAGLTVPLFFIYWFASQSLLAAVVLALVMAVAGFLFSAVGAYMAGLVGSSNNPISGVTIITVLFAAFALRFLGIEADVGPAATIFVAATIASAAAIGSDNIQDLKAGHLLGSTPRNQQVMQIVGVTAAAAVIALVLQVLHAGYTFGSAELPAPQAGLMAAVAGAVFGIGDLAWNMIYIGAGIAVALIIMDEILAKTGSTFRTPVMPVAVGIYLPVGLSFPIFLGGLIATIMDRVTRDDAPELKQKGHHSGLLMASGLVAGEALVGILVAALVATGASDALAFFSGSLRLPGIVMFAFVAFLLAYFVVRPRMQEGSG